MKFETLAIHAGQEPDLLSGAVMTPIYQTSTYAQERVGISRNGYDYSRTKNPTRQALENCLAGLEGSRFGLAFASGMAAIDTVMRLMNSGDHILVGNDVYGGTFRLFDKILSRYGLDFDFVDTTNLDIVSKSLRPQTRMVWLETPTNPLLNVTDIRAVAEVIKEHPLHPLLVVDNTFATPFLQRPLDLGAQIVVHSTTKYIGGHSDVIGGAIITKDETIYEKMAFFQNAVGAVPGPMDCFLTLRGIKTLPLRMRCHAENAIRIAEFLATHPKVAKVYYPFHPSHPQYDIAQKQMRNGGGIVSFVVKDGSQTAIKIAEATRVFTLAESLGGVESLIEVPAAMTHLSVANSPLAIDPGLIRLSAGIEHVDDLLSDIDQALAKG